MSTPVEEVSAHLKKFNYEDWISKLDALSIWMYNFGDQHFPSTVEQKISDIEHQISLCIEVLESVPAEKRELNRECAMFEYLKGRFYNAIPDVYKEEAERHLLKATQLDPLLLDAWNCLGSCVAKKGNYQEAKEYYQTALKMGEENAVILRQLADLELTFAQVAENPAKQIDECIRYAERTHALDDMDGGCLYILGCAHFTSFLLRGGWDHNNLQLALEAYEKAKRIDTMKSNPHLEYDCSMVNRYLENYKMSLTGFSDAALKNPASDALHQVKVTLQLLDKLKGLLQVKRYDKNKGKSKRKSKGKSKGKSMKTGLPAMIQSLANIDLNPSYKRVTVDLLTEGFNKQIEVVAAVRCLVKYEYKAPVYYMLCDSDENSFVLTAFGIQKEAIKQGDQVILLEPICKFIDFEWEGKHYQFKSVRVNLLEQVLLNGNPLPPSSAMSDSLP
ncbi:tetratricopeptide repeat protein 5-like [Solanum pennellii]|uniref:Tetratricopeptide repeat protein 5-like n=1 Tax=Solanum pennellii TaxID=28526 RepID=A0ABM1G293_SOLPN|nr:tetratricopeptide repeat protein 5-like [Solanum pennellii]